MAFNLEMYPISYIARYNQQTKTWQEEWVASDTISHQELLAMGDGERQRILARRNQLDIPAVTYTSQYGYGCFEGMKAYPRKDGKISIFRPDQNARRFRKSMEGLYCPPFPEELYVRASSEFIRRNAELGYVPAYNSQWEEDSYASASAVYMRPYMNSEAAIGIGISQEPYVVICATSVSTYFKGGNTKAITTNRIRATPHGTGWIKCASNYVISTLAKKEAEDAGYMEVVYLDALEQKYIQEGSSCNIFFLMQDGTLATPELGDTILPGITRSSIIDLARQQGQKVEERLISIEEVMDCAMECFVTGTAAGITPIESLTHRGVERVFNNRKPGELGEGLQKQLKGIQYGAIEDTRGWNLIL